MVLAIPGSIFTQSDVRETPSSTSSSTSSTSILAPVGSIMAWLKSFTNTPQALPTGWLECNGALLSDADSVYNGQNLPDLNGGEFIRGAASSGGTGGSATIDNHNAIVIANHMALTMNNHTALTVDAHDNHTTLTLSNHTIGGTSISEAQMPSHAHNFGQNLHYGGMEEVEEDGGGAFAYNTIPSTISSTQNAGSGNTHTHSIGAHSFSQNIDAHSAHAFGQNISNHSFSTNIDAHSTNLPPYYNVVWIIRVK